MNYLLLSQKKHMQHINHNKTAIALLFAVLVSTMMLLLGVGILNRGMREANLSSQSKESNIALYAADSALECALFLEYQSKTNTQIPCGTDMNNNARILSVAQGHTQGGSLVTDAVAQEYNFAISFKKDFGNGAQQFSCATVTTFTNQLPPGQTTGITLGKLLIARGYNMCTSQNGNIVPDVANQILVERRLEAWYPNPIVPVNPNGPINVGSGIGPALGN
jgi:hypothetical protein